MIRIVLDDEQVAKLSDPNEPVELVDRHGRMLRNVPAQKPLLSDEEYAEIKRSMENDDGVRYTTKEVLEYLKTLDVE